MPRTKLTPKQSAFVAEYLVDFNATQAAVRAGYSVKAAAAIARETLQNPQVAAALAAARAQRAKRTEITADRVLREIAILAFSDVRNYEVSADGKLTLREGVPDAAWRAVSSVKHKIHPGGRDIEYRLWDKNAALEKVAKHIRFYPPDKVEVTGESGGPLVVAGVAVDDLSDLQLAALAEKLASAK